MKTPTEIWNLSNWKTAEINEMGDIDSIKVYLGEVKEKWEQREAEKDNEWLNKILPEQLEVSLKQERERIIKIIDEWWFEQDDRYEGGYVKIYSINIEELKQKIKED